MTMLITAARRSLWLVLLAATAGAVYAWWRDRDEATLKPAEWPPLAPAAPSSATAASSADIASTSAAPASASAPPTEAASVVNALVDAPEARSTDGDAAGWVVPDADGSCPLDHPVKANDNSGIFHVPGGRFYDRTKAERCYASESAAVADGYRRAKH